ncbi:hypothetical protein M514_24179 [Trichuris suis]|uniref:Uncharacterized protein n=1 Tax=Trichuris suis TaxID=68888 RepID=A0A085N2F1_9BILA|nr:hypothetical protein M514_24179 [Trichuris suis]
MLSNILTSRSHTNPEFLQPSGFGKGKLPSNQKSHLKKRSRAQFVLKRANDHLRSDRTISLRTIVRRAPELFRLMGT